MPDVVQSLRAVLPPDQVDDSDLARAVYARDGSFFEYRPRVVVRANREDDVRAVLAVARSTGTPVTFRAGGTSLSGQTVGEGIIVDVSKGFSRIEPLDGGARVRVEPGPTGGLVNAVLARHGRKIGPDPASLRAARIGGILANNSSGMTTGVRYNAYRTLDAMRLVLVDGSVYDTAADGDRFRREQPRLAGGLAELRDEVRADPQLSALIRRKFAIKCVVGYGINALLDFDDPLDLFAHLVIGSEGTLAFVSEATLRTLPANPHRSSVMLLFTDASTAAAAVHAVAATGADAIEMIDDRSMRTCAHLPGVPGFVARHPTGACALLLDYQRASASELDAATTAAAPTLRELDGLLAITDFSADAGEHARLWRVRNDLFGIVGGARAAGTTILLEDVAVPLERLAALVDGLGVLFDRHGYHDSVVFGHAGAGNVHFTLTQRFDVNAEARRYLAFTDDLVTLLTDDLAGSLKAEHGTGRAMAAFVEREWGPAAYAVMRRIKELADPDGLLNPGVVMNADPGVHGRNLKASPLVWQGIDACIECGFCEHACPSRTLTLTPRQRIQASRAHAALLAAGEDAAAARLWDEYSYPGIDTCAADGLCATQCPVKIDTGLYTDHLRAERTSPVERRVATTAARRFTAAERMVAGAIAAAAVFDRLGGARRHPTTAATKVLRRLVPSAPVWSPALGRSPKRVHRDEATPDVVYFPACVSRLLGSSTGGRPSVAQTVLTVADRAGIRVRLPRDAVGACCSQIWEHKGYEDGRALMANRMVERAWAWSGGGRVPVLCDVTSCTRVLLTGLTDALTPANAERHAALRFLDLAEWLAADVLGRLVVTRPKGAVALHPTCACTQLDLVGAVRAVGEACADEAFVPVRLGCCGMAGDRGLLHPELPDAALTAELGEVRDRVFDGYYSLGRTCEIALTERAGRRYESLVYLVEEATRPRDGRSPGLRPSRYSRGAPRV